MADDAHVQNLDEIKQAIEASTPELMATALLHIAKTAAASRSSTRRTRWIERRARDALAGKQYVEGAVSIPKDAGPNTAEKLHRRVMWLHKANHQMAAVLQELLDTTSHTLDPEFVQKLEWAIELSKDKKSVDPF